MVRVVKQLPHACAQCIVTREWFALIILQIRQGTICFEHNHTHLVMANTLWTTRQPHTHVCGYVRIHVQHVFVYACTYMYMAIHTHTHIYIHKHIHTYKAHTCCSTTRILTYVHTHTLHPELHATHKIQCTCLQPPEAHAACNMHTACHHNHVPHT